jgi:hypothetical protein
MRWTQHVCVFILCVRYWMSSYEHMFTYLGHVYHSLASTWDKMLIDFTCLPFTFRWVTLQGQSQYRQGSVPILGSLKFTICLSVSVFTRDWRHETITENMYFGIKLLINEMFHCATQHRKWAMTCTHSCVTWNTFPWWWFIHICSHRNKK